MNFKFVIFFTLVLAVTCYLILVPSSSAQITTSRDWVGIYNYCDPNKPNIPCDPDPTEDGNYVAAQKAPLGWKYLNCTQGPNPTGTYDTGECIITMPSTPGVYELRLYSDDSGTRMATSNPIYVNPDGSGIGTQCQIGNRATGLISTSQQVSGTFGNFGQCITNTQSTYVPFKIPTYDELKTVFFNQVRTDTFKNKNATSLPGGSTQNSIPFTTKDQIYHVNGDLTISGNPPGSTFSGVVFVQGDLRFTGNYTYGSGTTGTVFVVKGNIGIDASVITVNAVLISEGIICTSTPSGGMASLNTNCVGLVSAGTNNLTVNGNLISLNQNTDAPNANPIRFRRNLSNNSSAAEKASLQAKYFVILKNLFSQTLQITTEVN